MEVASRIVIFSRGRLEQIGSPREVYEQPVNEFVARFIGVLNVLEGPVQNGESCIGGLVFPSHGIPDGGTLRIGFRPYAVQLSRNLGEFRYTATLRHTYFLGILLRVEIELDSGLVIKARITKEDYARLGLADGLRISFQIREYRVLSSEVGPLAPEVSTSPQPDIAEGI